VDESVEGLEVDLWSNWPAWGDATTKRVADLMDRREPQVFDQRGDVGKIIIEGSIARALAVPAPVVPS
jgi:hypothetical protein